MSQSNSQRLFHVFILAIPLLGLIPTLSAAARAISYNGAIAATPGQVIFSPSSITTSLVASSTPAVHGYPDRTFGNNGTGTVFLNFSIVPLANGGTNNDKCKGNLTVQPDDKIVMGGYSIIIDPTADPVPSVFSVARFLASGLPDPAFGQVGTPQAGTAYLPFNIIPGGGVNDLATSAAVLPNGNIIIGGYAATVAGPTNFAFALACFLPYGRLDTTFGQVGTLRAGSAYLPLNIINGGVLDSATSLAVQPDGKILLGGYSRDGGGNTFFSLARFLSNGQPDTTFGQVGTPRAGSAYIPFTITPGGLNNDNSFSIIILSNGNILLGGQSTNAGGANVFALARFLPNGQLDTTFGQVGTATAGTTYLPFTIIPNGINDQVSTIALQPNGNIVVGGFSQDGGGNIRYSLARFLPNGQLDTSFGQVGTPQAGSYYLNFGIIPGKNADTAYSMLVQPNGNITCGGASGGGGKAGGVPQSCSLAQFLPTGQPNPNFGQVGTPQAGSNYLPFSIIPNSTSGETASGITLQSDGKIIVGGSSFAQLNGASISRYSLARFLA